MNENSSEFFKKAEELWLLAEKQKKAPDIETNLEAVDNEEEADRLYKRAIELQKEEKAAKEAEEEYNKAKEITRRKDERQNTWRNLIISPIIAGIIGGIPGSVYAVIKSGGTLHMDGEGARMFFGYGLVGAIIFAVIGFILALRSLIVYETKRKGNNLTN